jgi:hypothetical protein
VVDGARSVREVQLVGGWRSKQTAHEAMRALQDVHLIDWEAGKAGTLRALVYRVPVDLTPLSVE